MIRTLLRLSLLVWLLPLAAFARRRQRKKQATSQKPTKTPPAPCGNGFARSPVTSS